VNIADPTTSGGVTAHKSSPLPITTTDITTTTTDKRSEQ
jgi:hypothetical protein